MKLAPGVFWGILLVIIGLSIILKIIFGISVFRIIFALFLIFIGIVILTGKANIFHQQIESKTQTLPQGNNEYNVIFGKNRFDFRDYKFENKKKVKIQVNTVFGECEILISKNIPVHIKIDAAFATATFPDNNSVVFGTSHYTSPSYKDSEHKLIIECAVVFGKLSIYSG